MASPLLSRNQLCLSCIRRVSGLGESLQLPSAQQIRGKKKIAKVTTINVKLRQSIAGFGRKGSIVPVPPGTMRNTWFPKKMAEYQTLAQLKALGDVVIERDSTYGLRENPKPAEEKKDTIELETYAAPRAREPREVSEAAIKAVTPPKGDAYVEPEVLSAKAAATITGKLAPARIEFYRTPMPPPPPPQKVSSSLASNSALSAAAATAARENAKRSGQKPTSTAIYGSVSTADIAANLKAILWEDIDGSRVVLSPEHISFEEQATLEDGDRVKHLGSYSILIRFGSAESEIIRRTVAVLAQG